MLSSQFFPDHVQVSAKARQGMDEIFELLNSRKIDRYIGKNGICWIEKHNGRDEVVFKIFKNASGYPLNADEKGSK